MIKKRKKKEVDLRGRIIVREVPKSPISEQYRTIRTNIEFSMVDKELKSLMCTSSNPEEGKTKTISNLAVSFAHQGKKVLFVDADLRKPTAHLGFKVDNQVGLTNVLTKKVDLGIAIVMTDVEGLWFLPSGPVPPNPAELLGSQAMKDFIEMVSEQFDLIIFDAPPVLAVTDAQILGNLCDGTLLVVRSRVTEKGHMIKAKGLLDKANVNLIGSVLNGAERSNLSQYYYGK